MSLSLYRKYRPQKFADVSGQKAAIDVITNSIAKNRVGHAYLFSGSRGCGKTSVARIFAKALNCLNRENFEPCGKCKNCEAITNGENLDVIEIDGASNNGVDEVRELKVNVTLAPFNSKYKIYIIDEVHMLSIAAFNALLKTLEEPPEHVIFILATTEPLKVPVTIRSRCQHIPFHSITPEDIFSRLEFVCKSENINFEAEALWEISRQADGALRDALSLLEQVIAAGEVNLQNVEKTFGAGSRSAFERWIKLFRSDMAESYSNLKSMFDSGASGIRIFEEMFMLIRDLWLVSQWKNNKNIINTLAASEHEKTFLIDEAKNWNPEDLHALLNSVLKILTQARAGIKNDILLGMFMLFVENWKKPLRLYEAPPLRQGEAISSGFSESPLERGDVNSLTERLNQVEGSDTDKNIPEDLDLKEKLLNISLEQNFMLHCGIFHTEPYLLNGNLFLRIKPDDIYIFEVLRQERNSILLANMFSDYENVILKFGNQQIKCTKQNLAEAKTETKPETNTKTEIKEAPEVKKSESHSYFDDLRGKLMRAGLKSEIIMIRHNEAESEENEITEQAEQTEQEEED
ncbi:MAG: DNA polymerase III subunit gamma/tau [Synergistaceae bacterium]|nr:DNA polymerase III subunit gamma/tau [Synergistaceae bacterium]